MTEQQRAEMSPTELALAVLREHGLVVIAIGALAWQVWLTMGILQDEASRWRVVIDSFRAEMATTREARIETVREIASLAQQFIDVSRRSETLQQQMLQRLECARGTNANQPSGN